MQAKRHTVSERHVALTSWEAVAMKPWLRICYSIRVRRKERRQEKERRKRGSTQNRKTPVCCVSVRKVTRFQTGILIISSSVYWQFCTLYLPQYSWPFYPLYTAALDWHWYNGITSTRKQMTVTCTRLCRTRGLMRRDSVCLPSYHHVIFLHLGHK